jgi:cysteine desulfurase
MHALISVIEHSSVRECFNHLSDLGVKIDVVGVGSDGIVDLETVKKLLTPKTVIVSIMTVNNEIGSVQPVREIAKVIRDARKNFAERPLEFEDGKKYPIFHTDASQAALFMDLNIEKLGVDLITLDAGKLYGPRGTGALFVRRGTSLIPVLYGGGQQSGLRSGTENIPGIAGMAEALKLVRIEIQKGKELSRIRELKDMFLHGLVKIRPGITVNGATDPKLSSPYILNVHIPDIDSEFFIMQMDALGVSCSTKSSCLRDEDESYVLKAIGADSKTSVRFSFGRMTKKGDVTAALNQVKKILS